MSGAQLPLPNMPFRCNFAHTHLAGTRVVDSKTQSCTQKLILGQPRCPSPTGYSDACSVGAGLAKPKLQHMQSFGMVALASKWHLFTPILRLTIFISVTSCSWETFGHGHKKDSEKYYLLWWLVLGLLLQVGTLLLHRLSLGVSSQPLTLCPSSLASACLFQPPRSLTGSQGRHLILVSAWEAFDLPDVSHSCVTALGLRHFFDQPVFK